MKNIKLKKIVFYLLGFIFIIIFFAYFRYSRLQLTSFTVPFQNNTSFPNSSLKIVNSGSITVDRYNSIFSSGGWLNYHDYHQVTLIDKEDTIFNPADSFKTIKLSASSFLANKSNSASGYINFVKLDKFERSFLGSFFYDHNGKFEAGSLLNQTGKHFSLQKGIILQEYNFILTFPTSKKELGFNTSESAALKWEKDIDCSIYAQVGDIKFGISSSGYNFGDTLMIQEFLILPKEYADRVKSLTFVAKIRYRSSIYDYPITIPLQYDPQSNTIYWSEENIKQFYVALLPLLAECQEHELLKIICSTKQIKLDKALLNNLLIQACDAPYWAKQDTAFIKDNLLTVSFLLEKGADPNAKDKEGIPVIFSLIQSNSLSALKKLIEYGANLNVKRYNDSPLKWANDLNFQEMALYLEGKMK